ncbi:unnamed protein product [Linum trigynum]|uniref:Uncharacterized protein n=1 Tax=Linum trigynum TaxID=586398 RepID=A0AAV2F594_9ROSI
MGHLHLTARTTRPKRRSELACTACATTWARAAPRASISPARANSRLSPRLMSSDLRHYMGSRRPTRQHLTSPGQLAALAPLDVIRPIFSLSSRPAIEVAPIRPASRDRAQLQLVARSSSAKPNMSQLAYLAHPSTPTKADCCQKNCYHRQHSNQGPPIH